MKLFQNKKNFIILLATLSSMSLLPNVASYDEVCDEETGLCSVSPYLDPTELLEEYPDILSDEPPENKNILCPFLRLVERYGLIGNDFDSMPHHFSINNILGAVEFLGTKISARALAIPLAVSLEQTFKLASLPWFVNLENLHLSTTIAHDCGIQFAKGASETDDYTRNSTLTKLAELADDDGHLSINDIAEVKYSICEEQGVESTLVGRGEMVLLFTFLGGGIRGYVEYSDVERFLYTKLPMTVGLGSSTLLEFPEA